MWDPLVRLFHWSLALSFVIAWFSANAWDDLHIWAGYASGALILARVAWGVFGAPYARFSQFVRSPRSVLAYLKAIARGGEQRYVGHNPAGGAMVVALILTVTATSTSGWALTTDGILGRDGDAEAAQCVGRRSAPLGLCTPGGRHARQLPASGKPGRRNDQWAKARRGSKTTLLKLPREIRPCRSKTKLAQEPSLKREVKRTNLANPQ